MFDELGRCASQNQKLRGQRFAISQNPQYREQVGLALNFINHNRPFQFGKRIHGLRELRAANRVLKIKIAVRPLRNKHPGQCGLAALAGAQEGYNPSITKSLVDFLDDLNSSDHGWIYYHEKTALRVINSWYALNE